MKTLIIYKSVHLGNTEKVAKAMSEVLGAKLLTPEEVDVKDILDADLIGLGSGIYWCRHHKQILALVDKLPMLDNKKAFFFSTSGVRNGLAQMPVGTDFNRALRTRLEAKGFDVLGDFSCPGKCSWGPLKLIGGIPKDRPNDEDLQNARKFAVGLRGKLAAADYAVGSTVRS